MVAGWLPLRSACAYALRAPGSSPEGSPVYTPRLMVAAASRSVAPVTSPGPVSPADLATDASHGPSLLWSTAVALVCLAVGAVAKLPETVTAPTSDTGMFAVYGRMVLQGARPYVDFWDVHTPLVFYYWAAVERLAGSDWGRSCVGAWGSLVAPQPCVALAANALDLLLSLVAAALTAAIARRCGGAWLAGAAAAILVALFSNLTMLSVQGSNPTKLMLVPTTLAIWAFLHARDSRRATPWLLLSGAAAGASILAKQPGALVGATLLIVLARSYARAAPSRSAAGHAALTWASGLAALALLTVAYLAAIGSLAGFVDQAWVYNVQRFVAGHWQSVQGLSAPSTRLDQVVRQSAGFLVGMALIGAVTLWLHRTHAGQSLLLLWAALSLVAVLGFREFEQVIPPFAALAGFAIERMWRAASRDGLGLGHALASRAVLTCFLLALLVFTSGFQVTQTQRAWIESGPHAVPSDPGVLANAIQDQLPAGPIFVWGDAGQIYALSSRAPSSPYLNGEPVSAGSPGASARRAALIQDIQERPPSAIVIAPHTDTPALSVKAFPELQQMIASCYREATPAQPASVRQSWILYARNAGACATGPG